MILSLSTYLENFNNSEMYITDSVEEMYSNDKQSIIKLNFLSNFTNTINKNKTFFQFHSKTKDNVFCLPLGVYEESLNNILNVSSTNKSILCSSQYSNSTRLNQTIPNFDFVEYFEYSDNYSYLQNISNSKYVLSPHGINQDCYRHYESMYLSAIPITLKHDKLKHLEDMPVLILDSWDQLSEELLLNSYDTLINKSREKLDMNYWINLIRSCNGTD